LSTAAQKKQEKRDAIMSAALELFAERGFHGTAVPLIADKAGVGAGTIYRYFENKEALVNALFQHWKVAISAFVMQDFPATEPVRAQFHHFWQGMARFHRDYPTASAFLELHHHSPYLDEQSIAIEEASLQPAITFLEQTQQAQITKPISPVLLMAIVLGAFHGLVQAVRAGYLEFDEQTIEQAEQCCWEAIRQ